MATLGSTEISGIPLDKTGFAHVAAQGASCRDVGRLLAGLTKLQGQEELVPTMSAELKHVDEEKRVPWR
jgi:hypothetical protein